MAKKKRENIFWTSYSDLMTSLFFVMLVLFVLLIVVLQKNVSSTSDVNVQIDKLKNNIASKDLIIKEITASNDLIIKEITASNDLMIEEMRATKEQMLKIKEIQNSIENINREYFEYDPQYKRHTLKNVTVSFNKNSFDINDIPYTEQYKLIKVGRSIKDFVQLAVYKNPDVKYLMIIEGQSSKDDFHNNDYYNNDVLSYQRALSLLKYWRKEGVDIAPDYCEIIVSGSGQNSPFRVQPDNRYNRANQRFVIHIIPKPGNIE